MDSLWPEVVVMSWRSYGKSCSFFTHNNRSLNVWWVMWNNLPTGIVLIVAMAIFSTKIGQPGKSMTLHNCRLAHSFASRISSVVPVTFCHWIIKSCTEK